MILVEVKPLDGGPPRGVNSQRGFLWEVSMFNCSVSISGFIVLGLEVGGPVHMRG